MSHTCDACDGDRCDAPVYLGSMLHMGRASMCSIPKRFLCSAPVVTDRPAAEHANGDFLAQVRLSLPRIDQLDVDPEQISIEWSAVPWRLEDYRPARAGSDAKQPSLCNVTLIDEASKAQQLFRAFVSVSEPGRPTEVKVPTTALRDLAITVIEPTFALAVSLPIRFIVAPSKAVPGGLVPITNERHQSPRTSKECVADRRLATKRCEAYITGMHKQRSIALAAAPVTVFTVSHPYPSPELESFLQLARELEQSNERRSTRRSLVFVHMYTMDDLRVKPSVDDYIDRLAAQTGATRKVPWRYLYWTSHDSLVEVRHVWCPSYTNDWTSKQKKDVEVLRTTLTQVNAGTTDNAVQAVLDELTAQLSAEELVAVPMSHRGADTAGPGFVELEAMTRPETLVLWPCVRVRDAGSPCPAFDSTGTGAMMRSVTLEDSTGSGEENLLTIRQVLDATSQALRPILGIRWPAATEEFESRFMEHVRDYVKVLPVSDSTDSLRVEVHLVNAREVLLTGEEGPPQTYTIRRNLDSKFVRSDELHIDVTYRNGMFVVEIHGLKVRVHEAGL